MTRRVASQNLPGRAKVFVTSYPASLSTVARCCRLLVRGECSCVTIIYPQVMMYTFMNLLDEGKRAQTNGFVVLLVNGLVRRFFLVDDRHGMEACPNERLWYTSCEWLGQMFLLGR
jgi:hypothetical protein